MFAAWAALLRSEALQAGLFLYEEKGFTGQGHAEQTSTN
jgi:hypothetical protein